MGLEATITATFGADGAEAFTVDARTEVETGETLVVLGPSGSGKTLLLETIAGFHAHDGAVVLDDVPVGDLPPERRDFGFVFQDYMLFPHMTVRENVEFGRRYHEETSDPDELLARLGVSDLADRYPPTLSGGEKQRVALARALTVRPSVMLLDEPLSSLDVPTRQTLRDDLTEVLGGVTAIYVTHDRTTARAIADRIVVMQEGRSVQSGSPATVFERPASPMVARFTGANAIPLSHAPSLREALDVDGPGDGHLAIRPEAIEIDETEGDVRATVERIVREDATWRVTLAVDDATVDAFVDRPPAVDTDVWVTIPRDRIHVCR